MAPWVRTVFINHLPKLLVMRRPIYPYNGMWWVRSFCCRPIGPRAIALRMRPNRKLGCEIKGGNSNWKAQSERNGELEQRVLLLASEPGENRCLISDSAPIRNLFEQRESKRGEWESIKMYLGVTHYRFSLAAQSEQLAIDAKKFPFSASFRLLTHFRPFLVPGELSFHYCFVPLAEASRNRATGSHSPPSPCRFVANTTNVIDNK